jgi:tetratricopeptide (TPR) repeat protein
MKVLTSWPVPVFMALIFLALISTSDASAAGTWAAGVGLVFVLLLWSMFRELSAHAEISRALSIGDGAAALTLVAFQLTRWRRTRSRTPFYIYRAMAHELLGDWAAVEADLAAAPAAKGRGGSSRDIMAACLQVGALCEAGKVEAARQHFDRAVAARLRSPADSGSILAALAEGRLLLAEGELVRAQARLEPLTRNIRLGPAQRAIAHHYLARCARAEGRVAEAVQLHKQASALAPASWFASEEAAKRAA